MEWEKITANQISDTGLISRIYKEFLKLNNNKNPLYKWAKDSNRRFTKEDVQMANKHRKRCSSSPSIRETQIETTMRSLPPHTLQDATVNRTENKCWTVPSVVLGSFSCFNRVWMEQTQGRPFFPTTLQPLFQAPSSEPQPSSASETSQHRFFFFFNSNSSLPNNHELQIHQNYSTKVEAALNHLVTQHVQGPYTYLTLGFYLHLNDVALEALGHCFPEPAELKCEDAQRFLKMQNQCHCLPGQAEATTVLDKNWTQTLLDLPALGSARTGPQLRDFL
ncbi:uncharacterized protein LOC128628088 [Artibeus jamaicensis]|uniref:uncharacterized protein LOC128628088 n=1 Tax=Artibeus jamaicensis TaxID=9417 RepID=UPI00235A64B6|nr:uncharacterized protein LOC128628088 [Artibeus jamaicensis]XP_053525844.1 uncharacterized protein LOC128628088 [Artibeus jamaicensis]